MYVIATAWVFSKDRGLFHCCFNVSDCSAKDEFCQEEFISLEAIRSLHKKIDDDESGNIDIEESQGVSCPPFQCYWQAVSVRYMYYVVEHFICK